MVFLSAAAHCRAQSVALGLSSGVSAPGSSVTLDISLNATSSLPAAVGWTLAYSTVDFSSATIAAGAAATAANKQLSCTSSAGSVTCVLWSMNNTAVSSGVLATVTLPVKFTSDSSSTLQLVGGSAASPSGGNLGTSTTGGTVTIASGLNGFTCSPVTFAAGTTSSCTVVLTAAAPAGGATIALTASPVTAVTLPAAITIPQGSLTGAFSVTAGKVAAATSVMLTAAYLGGSQGFGVTLIPATTSGVPSISSLSPTSGAVGAAITIAGSNFGTTQGTSAVTFNGIKATPTSWSATSFSVPVPSGASSGNVVVTVNGAASKGATFTVLTPKSSPPSITSLSPSSATAGTAVTIAGANFGATQGTSTVTFNGTTARATHWSATSVAVLVPSGASSGNVVVTVGGVASNAVVFKVIRYR